MLRSKRFLAINLLMPAMFASLTLFGMAHSQTPAWIHSYGGPYSDRAFDIIKTSDGNIVICGRTDTIGFGDADVYLLKIDHDGIIIWEKNYGPAAGYVEGRSVAEMTDGGFAITGTSITMRTNSVGDSLWSNTNTSQGVAATADNGCITAGKLLHSGYGYDVYVQRYDSNGTQTMSYLFGSQRDETCYGIAPTADGGFIVWGRVDTTGEYTKGFLYKLDQNGDSVWAKQYTGVNNLYLKSACERSGGGFYATGSIDITLGNWDDLFMRLNPDGTVSGFLYYFASPVESHGIDIVETSDGGAMVIGDSDSLSLGEGVIQLYKVPPIGGSATWSRNYSDPHSLNRTGGVVELAEGWYMAAGYDDNDAYVFKVLPSPLYVVAYSPVNIIVEDPNGDQFGKQSDGTPITEISPADYYEDPNDSVVIYEPIPGDYIITFVVEDGAEPGSTYSAIIRIDGTQEVVIVADEDVPESGVAGTYVYTYEEGGNYTNGDSNGDDGVNIGDAVFLVNFVFKGGPAPDPLSSGDANCDLATNIGDAVYIINFVFKSGPPPCAFTS